MSPGRLAVRLIRLGPRNPLLARVTVARNPKEPREKPPPTAHGIARSDYALNTPVADRPRDPADCVASWWLATTDPLDTVADQVVTSAAKDGGSRASVPIKERQPGLSPNGRSWVEGEVP